MYRWLSSHKEATEYAASCKGGKIVAWPYPGASYGVKWCVFVPTSDVR